MALNESPTGSTLIVGAPGWRANSSLRAYSYVGNGSSWTLEDEITGTGPWEPRGLGGSVTLSGVTKRHQFWNRDPASPCGTECPGDGLVGGGVEKRSPTRLPSGQQSSPIRSGGLARTACRSAN